MTDRPDILVIGGGIFGLWITYAAVRAGARVMLAEAVHPGAGASGGVVGALTPHMPTGWRPFKAFQFAGLSTLGARLETLREETGIDTGYVRAGRLSPLHGARARAQVAEQAEAARRHWSDGSVISLLDRLPEAAPDLIASDAMPEGLMFDTLAARLAPRQVLRALLAAVQPRARVETGWRLRGLDAPRGRAEFDNGSVTAGHVVLAAGWESLRILPEAAFARPDRRGRGVKGQAALLDATLPANCPLIQGDGLYIVPHGPGRVAVGSTSEQEWTRPEPDSALDALIERARRLSPALRTASMIERWAGIRPRAPGREPLVGSLPGQPRAILATGGYKIGFGIAHLVGDAVARIVLGSGACPPAPEPLPASFAPEAHGLVPPAAGGTANLAR